MERVQKGYENERERYEMDMTWKRKDIERIWKDYRKIVQGKVRQVRRQVR